MSGRKTKPHAFVTKSALTAAERNEIATLCVKFPKRSHGNADSAVWSYFGELAVRSTDDQNIVVIDDSRRYCDICLKREQGLYSGDKSGRTGHISRVKSYSKSTATTSLADHLFTVQNVDVRESSIAGSCSDSGRQLSLQDSFAATTKRHVTNKPAATAFEFNRDLCFMICLDLQPFSVVSSRGFSGFCAKNLPAMKLPDESTLRRGALFDIYRCLKSDLRNSCSLS